MISDVISSLDVTSWILLSAIFLIGCIYYRATPDFKRKYPPTPGVALPVLGHIYLMKKDPIELYRKWRKSLGDVFMLKAGSCNMVVLNGHNILKEAFIKQADIFSGRAKLAEIKEVPKQNLGIIQNSGPCWREQRSTTMSILRQFGMGKNTLAKDISTEVDIYLKEIAKHKGEPVDLMNINNMSVSNITCAIIFGKRFELDDEDFLKMIKTINEWVRSAVGFGQFSILFPWMVNLPFDILGKKNFIRLTSGIRNFTGDIVDRKIKEFDSTVMTSLIDAYLKEMNKKKDSGIETYQDMDNLYRIISNMFVAGTETTSTTIYWCYLCMLHHPVVQDKIYAEILEHIGQERAPAMADRPKLKYLNAVILETQRFADIAPLSLPHSNTEDAFLNGFFIPKGSLIIPNLDSVLMDEDVWGDPQHFRPERFLDSDGNIVKKEEFVPFSLGRRVCLGESLASMELFLFLACAFQKFQFLPADPKELPKLDGKFSGGTRCPDPFKTRCVERQKSK